MSKTDCQDKPKVAQGLRQDIQHVIEMLPHTNKSDYGYSDETPCKGADDNCPRCLLEAAMSKHRAKPEASGIGNTLRDIAEESTLNPAERKSLRLIAKEYDSQAAELEKALELARDRLVRADTLAAEKAELEALAEAQSYLDRMKK